MTAEPATRAADGLLRRGSRIPCAPAQTLRIRRRPPGDACEIRSGIVRASCTGMTNDSKAKRTRPIHKAPTDGSEACVVAGEALGALLGSAAGPAGLVAGMVIGAAAGALAGKVIDQEDERQSQHDEQLDEDIGVTKGAIGRSSTSPKPTP